MKRAAALLVCASLCAPATAAEAPCGTPVAREGLTPQDYRPVFSACHDAEGGERLAIRRFASAGADLLLTVEPQTLATRIEAAQCLSCLETEDEKQSASRYLRAVTAAAAPPLRPVSLNAGLAHGAGGGAFLTGDLCPSRKPLDRAFFEKLKSFGPHTPVALAVSGRWLKNHRADFTWLKEQAQSGALDILWVDHSYSHRYLRDRPDGANFLLLPDADIKSEVLDTERLLLTHGVVPSVFFRFPGLVADAALLEQVRRLHLVALGADSWLVLGPPPRAGSILLVHPNGNEPAGLRLFDKLLRRGALPLPLRALTEAP